MMTHTVTLGSIKVHSVETTTAVCLPIPISYIECFIYFVCLLFSGIKGSLT